MNTISLAQMLDFLPALERDKLVSFFKDNPGMYEASEKRLNEKLRIVRDGDIVSSKILTEEKKLILDFVNQLKIEEVNGKIKDI